ncbi:MAG: 1-deoxy-D-xylulose-5-phosphate reductoisomerase [Spirochaetes bacterium]|nr:1-deoxy-D-xylulose-5-phosphate reductoisomerase [Spirochaetota bacterium]
MAATLTILGSTGSIGESTLRVLRALRGRYSVYGLSCSSNLPLLDRQIGEFAPRAVAVESADAVSSEGYGALMRRHPGVEFLEGPGGVIELAGRKADLVVSAIVGAAGLRPTLAAVGSAGRIALANKETLVMAGDLVMPMVRRSGSELIPVDSEHSAVFSLLRAVSAGEVARIILTASGGSLRDVPLDELPRVGPERALAHPTWDMGEKITIDSATLMNKGLEVIEAHHLFGVPYERIDVLMHPESLVHSLVEATDGGLYAHLGVNDMALPIMSALTYPERGPGAFGRLRLEEVGSLNFGPCDRERYPALELCYHAGKTGGTLPAVLNAANEEAVRAFLDKKILFTEIARIVEKTMARHRVRAVPTLEDIFESDSDAREISRSFIKGEKR